MQNGEELLHMDNLNYCFIERHRKKALWSILRVAVTPAIRYLSGLHDPHSRATDAERSRRGIRFRVPRAAPAGEVLLLVPQIGRARVGKECRSRWSPYH